MKANQKFVGDDEAVSPVIGVILMVAITVVLAAVVFVLVSDLGGDSESAPTVQFQKDETADQLKVIRAASNADWDRLQLTGSAAGAEFELNAAADGTGGTALTVAAVEVTGAANPMSAGEYVEFCGTAGAVDSLTVTVIDGPTNQILAEYVFSQIASCA